MFVHGWLGGPERLNKLARNLRRETLSLGLTIEKDISLKSYRKREDVQTWARDLSSRTPFAWNRLVFVGFSMGGKAVLRALADEEIGEGLKRRTELVFTINTPYDELATSKYGFDAYHLCKAASWMSSIVEVFKGKGMDNIYSGDVGDQGACSSLSSYSSSADAAEIVESGIPVVALVSALEKDSSSCNFGIFDPYPEYADDGMVPLRAQYSSSVTEKVNYGSYCHLDVTDVSASILAKLMAKKVLKYLGQ